jgi:hypothetical protein
LTDLNYCGIQGENLIVKIKGLSRCAFIAEQAKAVIHVQPFVEVVQADLDHACAMEKIDVGVGSGLQARNFRGPFCQKKGDGSGLQDCNFGAQGYGAFIVKFIKAKRWPWHVITRGIGRQGIFRDEKGRGGTESCSLTRCSAVVI